MPGRRVATFCSFEAATRLTASSSADVVADAYVSHIRSIGDTSRQQYAAPFIGIGPGLYGEGAHNVGVLNPPLKDLAKDGALSPEVVERLIASPVHEARMLGVHRTRRLYSQGIKDAAKREATAGLLLRNLHLLSNWDLIDVSCPFVIGDALVKKYDGKMPRPKDCATVVPPIQLVPVRVPFKGVADAAATVRIASELPLAVSSLLALAKLPPAPRDSSTAKAPSSGHRGPDQTLFFRRTGVVSALPFAKLGPSAAPCCLDLVDAVLHDPHDLMQKAAGWLLREVGKTAPAEFREYMSKHCRDMPRMTLRYSIEHQPQDVRKAYLRGDAAPTRSSSSRRSASSARKKTRSE